VPFLPSKLKAWYTLPKANPAPPCSTPLLLPIESEASFSPSHHSPARRSRVTDGNENGQHRVAARDGSKRVGNHHRIAAAVGHLRLVSVSVALVAPARTFVPFRTH